MSSHLSSNLSAGASSMMIKRLSATESIERLSDE